MASYELKKDFSLKEYNSFGVDVKARYFAVIDTPDQLTELLSDNRLQNLPQVIIGDATNILFTKDYNGVVIKVNIKDREVISEDDESVILKVGAGEDWHEFIMYAVENSWGGVENMALIPGTVGGACAGNIAAYGQNFCDVFVGLEAIDRESGELVKFDASDFDITYRVPIFRKMEAEDRYIITHVMMRLIKDPDSLETSYHERKGRYGSLEDELATFAKEPYTIKDIAQAVINIRERKLPDVEKVGSCGSFFRNPVVTVEKFKQLSEQIDELQSYPVDKLSYDLKDWQKVDDLEYVKIPAGRLLDELGWRGKWIGNAGVDPRHALCVISNKQATGEEILKVANEMKNQVRREYGVELESEVRII